MQKAVLLKLKKALEEKKESIEKTLASFAKKDESLKGDWDTKYPDFDSGASSQQLESAADEVERYATLLPIEYSLENQLRDIEDALEKMKKNRYGFCEKCKKPISQKRLQAFPEARTCNKCKK